MIGDLDGERMTIGWGQGVVSDDCFKSHSIRQLKIVLAALRRYGAPIFTQTHSRAKSRTELGLDDTLSSTKPQVLKTLSGIEVQE